jgi:hypothetical protein
MSVRFLFYVGRSSANDAYLALPRAVPVDHVYAGIRLKINGSWIPDFIDARIDRESHSCRITLIELEAGEACAKRSCRKYLPENPARILQVFMNYLDRVLASCRRFADPRARAFTDLK